VLPHKFGWEGRDPKDEPILECAERAAAERIVTGDHDPLSLAS
jgi:predicted nucleic acid-binding protein